MSGQRSRLRVEWQESSLAAPQPVFNHPGAFRKTWLVQFPDPPCSLTGLEIEVLLKGGGRQCLLLFLQRYPYVDIVQYVWQYKRSNWIFVSEFPNCPSEPVNDGWPPFVK